MSSAKAHRADLLRRHTDRLGDWRCSEDACEDSGTRLGADAVGKSSADTSDAVPLLATEG